MKNGLVIADAGPIFSLAVVKRLGLLKDLFDDLQIPKAVWIAMGSVISWRYVIFQHC